MVVQGAVCGVFAASRLPFLHHTRTCLDLLSRCSSRRVFGALWRGDLSVLARAPANAWGYLRPASPTAAVDDRQVAAQRGLHLPHPPTYLCALRWASVCGWYSLLAMIICGWLVAIVGRPEAGVEGCLSMHVPRRFGHQFRVRTMPRAADHVCGAGGAAVCGWQRVRDLL